MIFLTLLAALQVVAAVLLADFIGGLFHWAEDTYGRETTPVWGPLFVKPNLIHHARPAAMMKIPWFINNLPNWGIGVLATSLVWLADAVTWQFLVFAVAGVFNQQIHRFAHAPRLKLPAIVLWAQKARIIQNARHHWMHHTAPHHTHYCVMTPYLNPVLDRLRFWRGLERLLLPILGRPRQRDDA